MKTREEIDAEILESWRARIAAVTSASVNDRDRDGRPWLSNAIVWLPEMETIRRLMALGADVNAVDHRRWTALHYAAQERHAEITQLLLRYGATVDPEDKFGNTPLDNATYGQGGLEIIRLLVQAGAEPDHKNSYGKSPLDLAQLLHDRDKLEALATPRLPPELLLFFKPTVPSKPPEPVFASSPEPLVEGDAASSHGVSTEQTPEELSVETLLSSNPQVATLEALTTPEVQIDEQPSVDLEEVVSEPPPTQAEASNEPALEAASAALETTPSESDGTTSAAEKPEEAQPELEHQMPSPEATAPALIGPLKVPEAPGPDAGSEPAHRFALFAQHFVLDRDGGLKAPITAAMPNLALKELLSRFTGTSFNKGLYRVIDAQTVVLANDFIATAFPERMGRTCPFAFDWAGNIFAVDPRDPNGNVVMYVLGSTAVTTFPMTIEEFHEPQFLDEPTDGVLLANVHAGWIASGQPEPGYGECVAFNVLPFLGGAWEYANMGLCPISMYWPITAQIIQKARKGPEGQIAMF